MSRVDDIKICARESGARWVIALMLHERYAHSRGYYAVGMICCAAALRRGYD